MPEPTLPTKYCDIVMKGGVTSGVVYPLAVAELSDTYAFKNVGGTSAGAIAAAATAAAEFRRRSGSNQGFESLTRLPATLGAKNFLRSLFAPDQQTRPLFQALVSIVDSETPIVASARIWVALVTGYRWSSLLGAALGGILPLALWATDYVGRTVAVALGSLWVLAGMTLAAVMAAAVSLPKVLQRNRFGLCSGFRRGALLGSPPLTNWLYGYLNELAGLPITEPLTFRHLHEPPACGDTTGTPRMINLEMMTTNLTYGRPHRLPFPDDEGGQFFFAPEEWKDLFPPIVIDHLMKAGDARRVPVNAENLQLRPLPIADLPIVVAVRMSLSFPGLFSAVPLWAVDYTRKKNQGLPEGSSPTAERCWFSDGGICDNFPIHFFDSPLPRWPTFGIDLKSPHPDFSDEKDLVWLPSTNGSGIQPRWNRFDAGPAMQQVGGFVNAIIDSMQSWRENLESRMPGYRNRIVYISQRQGEGGLNLSMPSAVIERLSRRGRVAGTLLRTKFDFTNHVWVRYRSYVAALFENFRRFANAYERPVPQDAEPWPYVKGSAPPPPFPSYPLPPHVARNLAKLTADMVEAVERIPDDFSDGAPRPRPELRTAPRV